MKSFYLVLFALLSTMAQAAEPEFSCTVTRNEETVIPVKMERIGKTFSYSEGSPFSGDFIGMDYYTGMETVVLRIRENGSERLHINRTTDALDGKYNLTISSEKGGIFGQESLKEFRIDCELKNALVIR